jgi:large subunit ribosomal protein L24
MQTKLHIKKGDTVKVIAGNSRGMQGKVLVVNIKENTAIVEGINMVSKHTKPNAKNSQGGIVKQEAPVHISNLMVIDAKGNATRIGRQIDSKKEKLVRYSIKSGEVIK